ncbi:hypothetical protein ASD62_00510 [Phycicoccus sp. Root563]|nr:hypothetical protein ASD62_00510 [Phycicoccus sp. Root563]
MVPPRPDLQQDPNSSVDRVRRVGRWGVLPATLVSLALALVVCGRSLGRGVYLYRDFVTVPELARGGGLLGGDGEPPRAVPLDAVMAGLSPLLGTGVQQQVMLVATLFLAGTGVAVLLRRRGTAAMVAGAAVATWNPFVAERLALGQPPTLLAYSMTPWLVAAVRSRLSTSRALLLVLGCALPAALTPWGSLVAAFVTIGASLATSWRRRLIWVGGVTVLSVLWSLPWLVPALASSTGGADPDGARAFALRSDSALGLVGSALTMGGSWAAATVPGSRTSVVGVAASVFLVAASLVGLVVLTRRSGRSAGLLAGAAWLVPVAVAVVLAGSALELFSSLQQVPGVAIGRDTHRWLGLSAVASAVLVGVAVGELAWRTRSRPGTTPRRSASLVPGVVGAVVVLSAAVLSVPDLPSVVSGGYRPVTLPSDWAPMVRAAEGAAGRGRVLVLPFETFRRTPWVGDQPFLDPTPRALGVPVVVSRQLVVARGQQRWTVDDDVVTSAELGLGATPGGPDPVQLRRRGITAVVEWLDSPGARWRKTDGLVTVFDGPHFRVWAVTRGG